MTTYKCGCGRTYKSPIKLSAAPVCSGKKTNHSPKNMKEVK